jgi:nucleotide-binding universal stress UspA family protein
MHVLLATDGSEFSQGAERVLEGFPFTAPPKLTIVHVCPSPDLHQFSAAVTEQVNRMVDECRNRGQGLLNAAAQRCQSWTNQVETVLLDGHPAAELLQEVERRKPDVVVVGARGLGAVSRVLLGSVSERLVKHAPCSVLVAHPPQGSAGVRKLLIAADGSRAAQAAIDRFAQLKLGSDRSVALLGILERGILEMVQGYGGEVLVDDHAVAEQERRTVEARLKKEAERFKQATPNVTTIIHKSAEVPGDILDTAIAEKADLIVMGSHGQSMWERFLLGSVPLRVLHYAQCSVWIERPPQKA